MKKQAFNPKKPMTVTSGTVIDITRAVVQIMQKSNEALDLLLRATEEAEKNEMEEKNGKSD